LRIVGLLKVFNEFVDFIKAGGADDDVLPSGVGEESLRAD